MRYFFLIFLLAGLSFRSEAQNPLDIVRIKAQVAPEKLSAGEEVTLEILVDITSPYHIYSVLPNEVVNPTKIDLTLSEGLVWTQEEFQEPAPKSVEDPGFSYQYHEGKVTFTRKFKIDALAPKSQQIKGTFNFMPCTHETCLKPAKFPIDLQFELTERLLIPPIPIPVPENPVEIAVVLDEAIKRGQEFSLKIRITIQEGWHIYGAEQPKPYIATTVSLEEILNVERIGNWITPISQPVLDPVLGDTFYPLTGSVIFEQKLKIGESFKDDILRLQGNVRYQSCNETSCLAPKTAKFQIESRIDPVASQGNQSNQEPKKQENPEPKKNQEPVSKQAEPVEENTIKSEAEQAKEKGIWAFILASIGAGFVALIMPCVYPMIPITVSFFSKQSKSSGHHVLFLALVYFLGIVGTFTSFGLLLAVFLGSSGAQQVSSNPWVNLFITILFVAFSLSLFGLFEIQAPSFLISKASKGSKSGGVIGVLMMGFVFALTSFACTVPFVGGLLLLSVEHGDWMYPILGMVLFSGTMGLPFFFLALFPKSLNSLPQGGDWMSVAKISLGFVELWAATKFAVNVAQVWEWEFLTRSFLLSFWAGLTLVMSLYLMNLLKLKGHGEDSEIGPVRMMTAMIILSLAVYFFQGAGQPNNNFGFWEAFLPRIVEESSRENNKTGTSKIEKSNSTSGTAEEVGSIWHKQLQLALNEAKEKKKNILIDFTGAT
ncbi:MAG: cytochrome c biogenesis protein CcdA [Planctomycetota bacterium]